MRRKWLIIIVFLTSVLPLAARRHKSVVPDSLQRIEIKIHIDGKNSSLEKDLYLTMQRVEGGSFMMGATEEQYDPDILTDKPAHLVFLSPYYIATTEVTVELWRAVMPEREIISPRGYPTIPISYVSWNDCQEFVHRLDSITGYPFRLPTEAEWEYAARGGKKSKGYMYAGSNTLEEVAWYEKNCPYKDDDQSDYCPHEVALKHPNELGLYDMSGNVEEWCSDWYKYDYYTVSPGKNPKGPDSGFNHVARGGYWRENDRHCRISYRHYDDEGSDDVGFRLVLSE